MSATTIFGRITWRTIIIVCATLLCTMLCQRWSYYYKEIEESVTLPTGESVIANNIHWHPLKKTGLWPLFQSISHYALLAKGCRQLSIYWIWLCRVNQSKCCINSTNQHVQCPSPTLECSWTLNKVLTREQTFWATNFYLVETQRVQTQSPGGNFLRWKRATWNKWRRPR